MNLRRRSESSNRLVEAKPRSFPRKKRARFSKRVRGAVAPFPEIMRLHERPNSRESDGLLSFRTGWGRAWRRGTVGVALGAAGLPAVADLRGRPDLFGRRLQSTETGFADEVASAASLVMGQADERMPVVVVRGLSWSAPATAAATLIRPVEEDLFR